MYFGIYGEKTRVSLEIWAHFCFWGAGPALDPELSVCFLLLKLTRETVRKIQLRTLTNILRLFFFISALTAVYTRGDYLKRKDAERGAQAPSFASLAQLWWRVHTEIEECVMDGQQQGSGNPPSISLNTQSEMVGDLQVPAFPRRTLRIPQQTSLPLWQK